MLLNTRKQRHMLSSVNQTWSSKKCLPDRNYCCTWYALPYPALCLSSFPCVPMKVFSLWDSHLLPLQTGWPVPDWLPWDILRTDTLFPPRSANIPGDLHLQLLLLPWNKADWAWSGEFILQQVCLPCRALPDINHRQQQPKEQFLPRHHSHSSNYSHFSHHLSVWGHKSSGNMSEAFVRWGLSTAESPA